MKNKNNKIPKMIAGCMATVMSIAGGTSTGFAAVVSDGADYLQQAEDYSVTAEDLSHIHEVDINSTTFPDARFRAVVSADFDKDKNGHLDVDEIIRARNVHCEKEGVKSMKGIEYLVELRGIYCMNNEIETMDLSNNKQLTGVWCSGNKLTHLDFTPNPELEWVYCHDNNVSYLNVSNNPKMAYIECNTNPLKKLDVSQNPLLEHLMCGSCELTELDVSHNPNLQHLDAFRNKFTTLDVSHNPKMKRLNIWDNPGLGSIDVSHNPGLQSYNCAHNGVTSIDISNNPELNKLTCSYNSTLTELDLSHNPKLVFLDCASDGLSSLDLSHNPNLRFLQAFTNPFTTLNIGNNPYLVKTYNEGEKKSEYAVCKGHSWTLDYGGDTSTGGDNIFFLCFDDKVTLSTESDGTITLPNDHQDDPENITDPEDLITREAFVQTLYEMAGKPSVKGLKSRFTDVVPGAWYEDALLWGEANSICVGYPYISNDTFGIGKYISRQDVMLMLMRYSEIKNYKRAIDFGRSDEYLDYYDVDFDHWEAVCWSATWHIMEGKGEEGAPKSEQVIDPYGKATRTEILQSIDNMYEKNGINAVAFLADTPETTPAPAATTTTSAAPVTVVTSAVTANTTKYQPGDVTGDGIVDGRDASDVLTYYAKASINALEKEYTEAQAKAADYNKDKIIDARDASAILTYYAKSSVNQ